MSEGISKVDLHKDGSATIVYRNGTVEKCDNPTTCRKHATYFRPKSQDVAAFNDASILEDELDSVVTLDSYNSSSNDENTGSVEVIVADPFSEEYAERAAALRQQNVQEVRTLGLGSNFTVLNPQDGYGKDNKLWFGTCDKCGESVTSSSMNSGLWEHKIVTVHGKGSESHTTTLSCPEAQGVQSRFIACAECGEKVPASKETFEAAQSGEKFACYTCAVGEQ